MPEGYRFIKDESIVNMGFYEIHSGNRVFKATNDIELLIYHNIVEGYYWDKLGVRPVITIANLEEAS